MVLPAAFIVLGDSVDHAHERKRQLDRLVHPDSGLASLSVLLGADASAFDLDGPLPPVPESDGSKSAQRHLIELAYRESMSVRRMAQLVGGSYGSLEFIGTPSSMADDVQAWLEGEGCDGFNVMFPYLPQGLDDVVDRLVPELQRRGLFRRGYEGRTLREHLGLPRPPNRRF